MKKQLQLFLSEDDESKLTRFLKEACPSISFLNDSVWSEYPDVREGIENCDTGRVYLYEGNLEALPTLRREQGDIQGPIAGCVIQILRSRMKDGVLLSGRVAAGIYDNDTEMLDFVSRVWKCVKKIGRTGVMRPDGKIDRHYLVGHHTRANVLDGSLTIADRAVGMRFKPIA